MLQILLDDGRSIPLNGRVAEMVRYLSANAVRINGQEQGQVYFDYAGKSLKIKFGEVDSITVVDSSVTGRTPPRP